MNISRSFNWIMFFILMGLVSCKTDSKKTTVTEKKPPVKVPVFNSDSAYVYIENQLDFGIRVPGTASHKKCRDWMIQKFESFGAEVIAQDFTAQIYTGDKWPSTNIIAQYNPEKKERVILSAHWDSRFIAEEDPDENRKDEPIPGADDGGSGVGVLLEIARILGKNPIDLGVDIILWDAEDQGERGSDIAEQWCLGSQYWSRNKHVKGYRAKYGINLDMVGGKNPRFCKEGISRQYAGNVLDKVWGLAQNMGYSDMFVNDLSGGLVDDHMFVNKIAGVPMIDIINQPDGSSFVNHWHTHSDDISAINKRTLRVVGQIVTATIYKESDGSL